MNILPWYTGKLGIVTKYLILVAFWLGFASTFFNPVGTVLGVTIPSGAAYTVRTVKTDNGMYTVTSVSADLNTTRVLIDTASEGTCTNNCTVHSLATYIKRTGAFAGINGGYFCPASYTSCAGKTNSFDTLVMNRNKVYFNSDNNIYSTVPAVIFKDNWVRFVERSSDWGRDTSVDAVIANQPLLLLNGEIKFTGDGDPKKGSRGSRSFIGSRGSTVYIGIVRNATVAQAAIALKAFGLENALNLDGGGSTALWYGGYKAGPGRNIPNAIVLTAK